MAEVAWDFDSPIKDYGASKLNCRFVQRDGDVVLEPVPGWHSFGVSVAAMIASIGFFIVAYFVRETSWQIVIVVLAVVFPVVGFFVGRVIDRYEKRRGQHLVFSAEGRISLPRYQAEFQADESTEFGCHQYSFHGDQVEDLVLHHADTSYYLFSSAVVVMGLSGTERLRRELEEQLHRVVDNRG